MPRLLRAPPASTRTRPAESPENEEADAALAAQPGKAPEGQGLQHQSSARPRRVTRLTARGIAARDEHPTLTANIERDWRARFGDTTVTALRQALEPLVAGDRPRLYAGLEPYPDGWRARPPRPVTLPHYPMTLHRGGYPDGS